MKAVITSVGSQVLALTDVESEQRQRDKQRASEQVLLNQLAPTQEEVAKAEREIETITLLQEVGLI